MGCECLALHRPKFSTFALPLAAGRLTPIALRANCGAVKCSRDSGRVRTPRLPAQNLSMESSMHRFIPPVFLIILLTPWIGVACAQETNESPKRYDQNYDMVIIEAFRKTHDGWSSDEVILNEKLNALFLQSCQQSLPNANPADLNWRLMNLRKAGKLNVKAIKSNRTSVTDVVHIAEMTARTMLDRHAISTDRVMADPQRRSEFDTIAKSIDPDVDCYKVRKAAFQLRKARKLRPELITRIADWGREIKTFTAAELSDAPEKIDAHPGIYIFRDQSGYLYIGQTDNLQERLKSHLDQSHNQSLASYLDSQDLNLESVTIEVHSFDPKSRARETRVRRAYESELIASRKPRFNILP